MLSDSLKLLTTTSTFKHKVSSVLNRSSEFASKHMFDGHPESCWNSDQGTPQFITFDFCRPVEVVLLRVMFQGGFAALDASVEVGDTMDSLTVISILSDVEDVNNMQEFNIRDGKNFVGISLGVANIVGADRTDSSGNTVGQSHETASSSSTESPILSKSHHRYVRLNFTRASDFYGRITIYNLELYGRD